MAAPAKTLTHKQNLATGPLAFATQTALQEFELSNVKVHFSAAVAQTLTITVKNRSDSAYDTVLHTKVLPAGTTDYAWAPDARWLVTRDEYVAVDITDSGSPASVAGLSVNIVTE